MQRVTEKEKSVLEAISNSDYDPEQTWAWEPTQKSGLPPKSVPGVISSLVKKGLVWSQGEGEEAEVGLTEAGFDALKVLRG